MSEGSISLENNKALARQLTELLDRGDEAGLKALLAPNFISHFAGLPQPLNREMYLQVNKSAKAAFNDLRRTVEDLIAEGDQVVLRITARGTHTGPFQGFEPTGKLTKISGIAIRRIKDEKIVEEWVVNDQLGLLQQLGIIKIHTPAEQSK
jgi:steroid delta-isomerase-like uncharacterized protein